MLDIKRVIPLVNRIYSIHNKKNKKKDIRLIQNI